MSWNTGNQFGNTSMGGGGFTSPGGFMTNTTFESPSMSQDKQKSRKSLAMTPVTIAMIKNATYDPVEDTCTLDDVKLHQVTFVGIINKIDELATYTAYEIDDFTGGTISVRKWADKDENTDRQIPQFREDTYVRVHGYIKVLEGDKKTITAFNVVRVTDFNEITYHLLATIHSNLVMLKITNAADTSAVLPADGGGMQFGNTNNNFGQGEFGSGNFATSGMSSIQHRVLQAIAASNSNEGLSRVHIRQKLSGTSENNIREALDFLCDEGHIYSTIDDDHFRATNS